MFRMNAEKRYEHSKTLMTWLRANLTLVVTVTEKDAAMKTLSSNGVRRRWNERSLCG